MHKEIVVLQHCTLLSHNPRPPKRPPAMYQYDPPVPLCVPKQHPCPFVFTKATPLLIPAPKRTLCAEMYQNDVFPLCACLPCSSPLTAACLLGLAPVSLVAHWKPGDVASLYWARGTNVSASSSSSLTTSQGTSSFSRGASCSVVKL